MRDALIAVAVCASLIGFVYFVAGQSRHPLQCWRLNRTEAQIKHDVRAHALTPEEGRIALAIRNGYCFGLDAP